MLTILFDGIAYGMLLFILAVGLAVTMGLMNFINLAHGAFAMVGGYVTVLLMQRADVPFLACLPVAFAVAALLGAVAERTLYRPLYRRPHPGEGDMADDADTRLDDPNYLPRLKFPNMKNKVSIDDKIVGATVTVHHGIGGKSDLVLDERLVDKFSFDPQDGGTVVVSLNVACDPSTSQAGELHGKQDQDVFITITPPDADGGPTLF